MRLDIIGRSAVSAFKCVLLTGLILAMTSNILFGQALQPLPTSGDSTQAPSTKDEPLKVLSQTARRLENEQTFDFRYKFVEGEVIRWQVDHVAATETRAQNDQDKTNSRAQSIVKWNVSNVDSLGNTTIRLTLEAAEMSQQTDDLPRIEYNSRNQRAEVPEEYRQFAEWIGIPMATYQLNTNGQVIDRQEVYRSIKFGVGDVTIPLPGRPVRLGQAWRSPGSIMVRLNDGTQRKIVTQIEYRLQTVEDGIANISFDTQVLTPVDDPRIESQLMQQMSKGTVQFDLNRGQMIGMNLGWNRRCLGFKGPDSSVTYVAQYTMRRLEASPTSSEENAKTVSKEHLQVGIRMAEDGPIFRW
ncbi:MAG: hypothetical protein JNL67_04500 [Planctomycetaceae bacterium]|nr:hypothetical protein [Planctomycetaceae bacterium]